MATLVLAAVAVLHSLYALYWSGHEIARLDIQQGTVVGVGPVTVSRSSGPARGLGPVTVTQDMNPLSAILHVGYTPLGNNPIRYTVRMAAEGGSTRWQARGSISSSKSRSSSTSYVSASTDVQTFRVETGGPHVFDVDFQSRALGQIRSASLEIRANTRPVNVPLVISCAAGAVIALVITIATAPRQRRAPPPSTRGPSPRGAR